jgi:hypothetical protein
MTVPGLGRAVCGVLEPATVPDAWGAPDHAEAMLVLCIIPENGHSSAFSPDDRNQAARQLR